MLQKILVIAILASASPAFAVDSLGEKILGDWCLNTEEYDDEISVDGSKWTFDADGTYTQKEAHVSTGTYTVDGSSLKLSDYGTMEIISISESEMVGKVYSTYHFTKDGCLPIVEEAFRITKLNNSIIAKDHEDVVEIVESGLAIDKPDTRSSQRSTPLMVAARFGDAKTVEYLLSKKPDLTATNASGNTALEIAQKYGRSEIEALIRSAM